MVEIHTMHVPPTLNQCPHILLFNFTNHILQLQHMLKLGLGLFNFRIGSWQHDKVELLFLLKVTQVKDFQVHSYLPLMKKLQQKYDLSLSQMDLEI